MGVHGLWRLIEPSGKPVPLETLENKVLAVDISIWLHQAVKGFQDSKGASVPNAHLLGIYHRVCKLLYFKIKPVFVFDGGVPALKKQTISKRTRSKLRNISEADNIQRQLLNTLLKHTAVSKVLTEKIEASIGNIPKVSSRSSKEDMYRLPPSSEVDSTISSSEDESYSDSTTTDSSPTKNWDLHTIDMDSVHFKSLPVDVRHEILTDLKETRKQSSWGRLHELPKVSDDFSVYQMKRLLKRQAVQTALEDAEKEMGGKSLSLAELESILKDQGVITIQNVGNRIASDDTTKYLLVKNIQQAIEEAREKEFNSENTEADAVHTENEKLEQNTKTTKADAEYEEDLKRAISLSLESEPSTSEKSVISKQTVSLSQKPPQKKLNPAEFSFLENFTDADFASSSSEEEEITTERIKAKMSSAQNYMLEYSGLTPNEIAKVMSTNVANADSKKLKPKKVILPVLEEISEDNTSMTTSVTNTGSKEPKPNKEEGFEDITSTTDVSKESIDKSSQKSIEDTDNLNSSNDEEVGLISSSESSDPEAEPKVESKKDIIVINLNSKYNEDDDLFADIFKPTSQGDSISNMNIEKSISDIVVSSTNKLEEKNNFFSEQDIEQRKPKTDNISHDKEKDDINKCSAENTETKIDNISKSYTKNSKPDGLSQGIISVTSPQRDIKSNDDGQKNQTFQKPVMTEQELKQIKEQLQKDRVDLLNEKSTKERMAGNITDQMYQEAQELLELFGVPYIVAPMEAEAQCAFLDAIELTDGTITDDSDIWLFGGKTVYKNFFNQSKYVMEFRAENIRHHFKLTREQMVLLALLVGSDYTVGLQGVGPVTAMEILAAFPPSKGKVNEFSLSHFDLLSGLKEFRSWFIKGKSPGPGRSALKSKLKNLCFTESFPSIQVVQAYLDPKVETSREAFSWSSPNAMALIEFAREKFGWTKTKTEEIVNPVLKKLEESKHQKSIKDYFKSRFKIHSDEATNKMSKRVKSAITNMGRDPSEVLAEELQEELKKQPMKKPRQRKKGKEAPEFSKASSSKQPQRDSVKSGQELKEDSNLRASNKKGKVKLHKLKSENKSDQIISSNDKLVKEDTNQAEVDEETDITEKINIIRRRRKIKEAKAAIDIKKPKLTKEKKASLQFPENIPKDLEVDEEIQLLSQLVSESSQKVEDINKTMDERLKNLDKNSLKTLITASPSVPNQPQPSSSNHRPTFRPTRIPRKETIPQKDKDKTMLLRNKLKAIEVFRRGKHGPGFIPKKDRKKRLPKTEAELSESSDE